VLLPIFIEAADFHGAAAVIEPALNAVTHVGRAVDLGILIMRNAEFIPLCVADQVRGAFQGVHLANH
jgi:hypothetical protein